MAGRLHRRPEWQMAIRHFFVRLNLAFVQLLSLVLSSVPALALNLSLCRFFLHEQNKQKQAKVVREFVPLPLARYYQR
jgi:uncharacterized BrkB/YihY/UPF0761 family membrane protein